MPTYRLLLKPFLKGTRKVYPKCLSIPKSCTMMLTNQGRLRVFGTYARWSFLPRQDVRERWTRNRKGCRIPRSCHGRYGNQGRTTVGRISDKVHGAWLTDRIYRLLRCHWNRPKFASIKSQYQTRYRTTLRKRVEGETTGKYEKALVAIIEQS
jgi:hypothetical protein